jgi:hypothetical protein
VLTSTAEPDTAAAGHLKIFTLHHPTRAAPFAVWRTKQASGPWMTTFGLKPGAAFQWLSMPHASGPERAVAGPAVIEGYSGRPVEVQANYR